MCVLVFTNSMVHDSLVYFDYLWNQHEITALFCVNKDQPELQCNGKCHLKDMLTQGGSEEKQAPLEFEFEQIVLAQAQRYEQVIAVCSARSELTITPYRRNLTEGFLDCEIPPPRYSA